MRKKNGIAGFTLIELMIVIGIVGTLIAATTIAYSNHLQNTRDARRKLDLEELRISLERYRTDTSSYPDDYTDLQTEGYIAEVPDDPLSDQLYQYEYNSGDDLYRLSAELENTSKGAYYIVTPKGSVYEDTR